MIRTSALYLTILITISAPPAFAQKVYKCGNTYSQQPCGANTQEIEIKAPPPDNPTTVEGLMDKWRRDDERRAAESKKAAEVFKEQEAARKLLQQERARVAKEEEDRLKAELDALRGRPKPDDATIKANFDRCESAIKLRLKDPMSAVFEQRHRLQEPMITPNPKAGKKVLAHAYLVSVNAKNSFGGYVGFKGYTCYFNVEEDAILFILD